MAACKVMLIDDDQDDQWIVRDSFELLEAGDILVFAKNGENALSLLQEQFESDQSLPRLIVLDLNMPIMNGTSTLRRIKEDVRFQHIPVIIYSTSINPFEQEKCMELGAHSYITKPISMEESVNISKGFLAFCA